MLGLRDLSSSRLQPDKQGTNDTPQIERRRRHIATKVLVGVSLERIYLVHLLSQTRNVKNKVTVI